MGLIAAAQTSGTLNRVIGLFVGPILIVAGGMMLGLLPTPSFGGVSAKGTERLGKRGDLFGAAILGANFALSFCPSSAAIFFGGLLPLATKYDSVILVPNKYGIATGLPVLVFAGLIASGSHGVGKLFAGVQQVERWLRVVTALLLLSVGLYLALRTNFGI